ncbi:DNA gyrase inhibitor YacG [Desulfurobacterium sp.]
MKEKTKKLKCPTCGKETEWENNPFRPFCSEKCKLADLHKWLTEEYTVIEEQAPIMDDNEN